MPNVSTIKISSRIEVQILPSLKKVPSGIATVRIHLLRGAIPPINGQICLLNTLYFFFKSRVAFFLTKTAGRIRLKHLGKLGLRPNQEIQPSSLGRARSSLLARALSMASAWTKIWVPA